MFYRVWKYESDPNGTYLSRNCGENRHSRVYGNSGGPQKPLDSRMRGNDRLKGLWQISGEYRQMPFK